MDLDVAITAIYGAMWYRLLFDEPLDAAFVVRLVDFVTNGVGGNRYRLGEQPKRLGRKK